MARPYPAFHSTTAEWRRIPSEQVRLADLIPTQEQVSVADLLDPDTPFSGDEVIHVVRWRNRLYIEDGHHRYVRAMLRGRRWIAARVRSITR